MENKKHGNIIPFPLLTPPKLPDEKLNINVLDTKIPPIVKLYFKTRNYDFNEKWLIPELRLKNIPAIKIGLFVKWSTDE